MVSHGSHRYASLAGSERDSHGEAEKASTGAAPTGGSSTARTLLLMLVSGIAGAFILGLIQIISSTLMISPGAGTSREVERLRNLLSCESPLPSTPKDQFRNLIAQC